MIEKFGNRVDRTKEVPEGNERSNRLSNFVRKLLFYSGGYQVLKSQVLAGNDDLVTDLAEYFQPEIIDLRKKSASRRQEPPVFGSSDQMQGLRREVIAQRAQEIEQMFAEAGIDPLDRDRIAARTLSEVEAGSSLTHGATQ